MKRKIDEIPVSNRLDAAVAIGLNRAKFIHKKRIAKRSLATAASLAVAFSAFLLWGFSNPVLASQIPFIGHIFMQNEEKISFSGNYADKANPLPNDSQPSANVAETTENSTEIEVSDTPAYYVHDENYAFTANEVYCDGSSLYFGMTVKADNGFGKIFETATERYGKTSAQMLQIIVGTLTIHTDEPIEIFLDNAAIEGTQTSADTLEGILKINLQDVILPANQSFTADLNIMGIWYGADGSPDLRPGISYLCGDWNIPSIPFAIDDENVNICQLNDVNTEGFGIENVIITPYEVKVQYILPPIYENYGPSLFDANGHALEFQEEKYSKDGNSILATYSVKDTDTSTLYFYIGEGDHETIKETDQNAIDARAVYKYTIHAGLE